MVEAKALKADIRMYSIDIDRAVPGTKADTKEGATMIIMIESNAPAIAWTLIKVNSRLNLSISF
jgi:hypothetical protein